MCPVNINYNLFRIRVYSPDGIFLMNLPLNNQHSFYCQNLVPGQNYNIVFTYDKSLILCLSFTCKIRGKIVLINPAHIIYNCALVKHRYGFISVLLELIKGGDEMEIVGLGFEKVILKKIFLLGKENPYSYFKKYGFYMFKAGDDMLQHFKNDKNVI